MKIVFPPTGIAPCDAIARRRVLVGAWPAGLRRSAFTLVELLVVMAIAVLLIGLATPAINALKNSGDVTSAAYDLSDTLSRARAFALANNTYVWVGFFEEDGSRSSARPAVAGTGRIVVSTIFSKDGTSIYDPSAAAQVEIDPLHTRLAQFGKLLRIDHAHLTSFPGGDGTGVSGSGPFAGRPAPGGPSVTDPNLDRISDQNPQAGKYTFTYPLGASATTAQYTFSKLIQISPRGETRLNCVQDMQPVIEIGLVRANGAVPDAARKNVVAIQMSGIASNLTIYRP